MWYIPLIALSHASAVKPRPALPSAAQACFSALSGPHRLAARSLRLSIPTVFLSLLVLAPWHVAKVLRLRLKHPSPLH